MQHRQGLASPLLLFFMAWGLFFMAGGPLSAAEPDFGMSSLPRTRLTPGD